MEIFCADIMVSINQMMDVQMTKLPLNENLLAVICMVQAAKNLYIAELKIVRKGVYVTGMEPSDDWYTRTRKYFSAIDTEFLRSLGLKKNEYCFESILDFDVTDEIRSTLYDDLGKFTLKY